MALHIADRGMNHFDALVPVLVQPMWFTRRRAWVRQPPAEKTLPGHFGFEAPQPLLLLNEKFINLGESRY